MNGYLIIHYISNLKKIIFGWESYNIMQQPIGNLEVLKFLHSNGFNLFEENDDKKQPVHILVKCSSIHFVEWEKIYSIFSKKYSDEKKGGVNVLKWILNIEKTFASYGVKITILKINILNH